MESRIQGVTEMVEGDPIVREFSGTVLRTACPPGLCPPDLRIKPPSWSEALAGLTLSQRDQKATPGLLLEHR